MGCFSPRNNNFLCINPVYIIFVTSEASGEDVYIGKILS